MERRHDSAPLSRQSAGSSPASQKTAHGNGGSPLRRAALLRPRFPPECGRDSCCAQPLSQLSTIIQTKKILSSLNENFLHQYAKYDLIIIKQYYREHITQRLINGNWFQRQKEIDRIFFEIRRKSWRDFCTKYSIPHSCTAQYNIKTWLYSSIKPSRIKYLFIKDIIALIPVISFAVIDIITPDKPHLIIRYAVCIFIYILILATYHWVINIFKIIPYVKYRDLLKIIDAEIEEAPMTFEK